MAQGQLDQQLQLLACPTHSYMPDLKFKASYRCGCGQHLLTNSQFESLCRIQPSFIEKNRAAKLAADKSDDELLEKVKLTTWKKYGLIVDRQQNAGDPKVALIVGFPPEDTKKRAYIIQCKHEDHSVHEDIPVPTETRRDGTWRLWGNKKLRTPDNVYTVEFMKGYLPYIRRVMQSDKEDLLEPENSSSSDDEGSSEDVEESGEPAGQVQEQPEVRQQPIISEMTHTYLTYQLGAGKHNIVEKIKISDVLGKRVLSEECTRWVCEQEDNIDFNNGFEVVETTYKMLRAKKIRR